MMASPGHVATLWCFLLVTQWSRGGRWGHKQELFPLVRPLSYEGGQSFLVQGDGLG